METRDLTNDLLKSKMVDAVVKRDYCEDFDQVTESGIFNVSNSTKNHPTGAYRWGILVVYVWSAGFWAQAYFPHNASYMLVRVSWVSSYSWIKYNGAALT